jgi:hypothetical protein
VKISAKDSATSFRAKGELGEAILRIYPNPLSGNELLLEYAPQEKAVLTVYNELGSVVLREQLYPGQKRTRLTLSEPGGLYLLRIVEGKRSLSRMVVKH